MIRTLLKVNLVRPYPIHACNTQKHPYFFGNIFLTSAFMYFEKNVKEEMLNRTKATTLFQIVCEFRPNSKVIFKGILGTDNSSTNITSHETLIYKNNLNLF